MSFLGGRKGATEQPLQIESRQERKRVDTLESLRDQLANLITRIGNPESSQIALITRLVQSFEDNHLLVAFPDAIKAKYSNGDFGKDVFFTQRLVTDYRVRLKAIMSYLTMALDKSKDVRERQNDVRQSWSYVCQLIVLEEHIFEAEKALSQPLKPTG